MRHDRKTDLQELLHYVCDPVFLIGIGDVIGLVLDIFRCVGHRHA